MWRFRAIRPIYFLLTDKLESEGLISAPRGLIALAMGYNETLEGPMLFRPINAGLIQEPG
jgi:hypothetical protein